MSRTPLRRFAAGLAILAMLLASLAPAISRSLEARPGLARATAICTQEGAVPAAPGAPHADAWDCCPFCSGTPLSDGLPASAWQPLRLDEASQAVPAIFLLAPRPLFAWAATRSRAPPSAS